MAFLCSVLGVLGIALCNEIKHAYRKKAKAKGPAKSRLQTKNPII
ncbi:hypothetical protein [Fictibacillus sp. NRS-1165]